MFTKTFHSSLEAYKRTLPNSYFTTYPKLNDINNTQKKNSCRRLWLFLIILPCLDKTLPRFISERLFNTKIEEKNKETDKFSESLGAFQK